MVALFRAILVAGRRSPRHVKAAIPAACCFAAFAYFGWQLSRGSADLRLDRPYKVEIIIKGSDGKVIPIIGQAPK